MRDEINEHMILETTTLIEKIMQTVLTAKTNGKCSGQAAAFFFDNVIVNAWGNISLSLCKKGQEKGMLQHHITILTEWFEHAQKIQEEDKKNEH